MNDLETRLTAALTDTARRSVPDSLARPSFRPEVGVTPVRGRWLAPLVAAAVVVALAVGVLLGAKALHQSVAPAAPPVSQVVFHTVGGVKLTQDQLQSSARTVTARLIAAGVRNVSVAALGSDELVVAGSFTSAQRAELSGLLVAGALEFRPLLTFSVQGSAVAPLSKSAVDPWAGLGFAPATDSVSFRALKPAQQQAMLLVVKNWNCGNTSAEKAESPVIACDSSGQDKYLMGTVIVSAGQVKQAAASPPGSAAGQLQWTVNVDLTPAGQQAWADYTAHHNEMVDAGSDGNVVADVVDGQVIVASTIQSQITGTTQITGSFSEDSATSLAGALSGTPLAASFVE